MNDGWVEPMRRADGPGHLAHDVVRCFAALFLSHALQPWEVVRQVAAGDVLLQDEICAEALDPGPEIVEFFCAVGAEDFLRFSAFLFDGVGFEPADAEVWLEDHREGETVEGVVRVGEVGGDVCRGVCPQAGPG